MKGTLLLFLFAVVLGTGVFAQTHTITGKVLDEAGQGFPGAVISVKGTGTGTASDVNGDFSLDVPDGINKLVIQALGFNNYYVTDSGQGTFVIKLQRKTQVLEGAVVTALGLRREKREVGYNSTTIGSNELTAGNNTSALSALQGKVAGANITSSTGGPGGSTRIVLRGEKSILKNNNALIVVDGVITNNNDRTSVTPNSNGSLSDNQLYQVDFGNTGNDLDPDEIESI
ncbi:MAG: SusC/RagA family TonB-linked outer membrane protein, partial [Chitinophagia bacterium]|nr:SusC/RagA family TonB-linked outer membrane protein [Chitinophagia bacterium]